MCRLSISNRIEIMHTPRPGSVFDNRPGARAKRLRFCGGVGASWVGQKAKGQASRVLFQLAIKVRLKTNLKRGRNVICSTIQIHFWKFGVMSGMQPQWFGYHVQKSSRLANLLTHLPASLSKQILSVVVFHAVGTAISSAHILSLSLLPELQT